MCGYLQRGVRRVRRPAVVGLLAAGLLAPLAACGSGERLPEEVRNRRVLVLGMDGLDPGVLQGLMAAGRAPNFARLAALGGFKPLATSMPPQSPVAWSNFISGSHPGAHQIYDFVHRDPNPSGSDLVVEPYLSTSRTVPPERDWALKLGDWRIPLAAGKTVLLRRGDAFWNHLLVRGVDATIYRVPANYPPPEVPGGGRWRCVCGMGTPDVLGTYGEFTVFTPDAPRRGRYVGGGKFVHLDVRDHRATARLEGPENFLRRPDARGRVPALELPIEIVRDAEAAVVRIAVGGQTVLLNEGEWSEWVRVEFRTGVPGAAVLSAAVPTSVRALVRFHVRQVHPKLELYVSPPNIDPLDPVTPISAPEELARELAEATGLHYTAGIPEDAKALRSGALNEDEFLAQVALLADERLRQYRYALDRFERGCLFYYFGHTDQLQHLFWRDRDPEHPGRDPSQGDRYADVIDRVYAEMDAVLGATLARLRPDDTLIVLSDHGFAPFRWGFNLNTWLLENGYLAVLGAPDGRRELGLGDVDWGRTRAYGLGLNSLYLNLRGREKWGTVDPAGREALCREIAAKLLAVRDARGIAPVETVYFVDRDYAGADPQIAPDLLVGYSRGYRASWATVLGGMPPEVFEDNLDRWSGDHLIAAHLVPGILLANRPIVVDDPSLSDIGPTILSVYGIATPPGMTGRPVLAVGD